MIPRYQYGYSLSQSSRPAQTWSMVTDLVRWIHLYHSKNRLSTKISNGSLPENDGLGTSSSISPLSSPRTTSRHCWDRELIKVATHREDLSPILPLQGQWVHVSVFGLWLTTLWLPTLTSDETKLRPFPRTRSRIFGLNNFIHFSDGRSYAVKSVRCRSVDRGHIALSSERSIPVSQQPFGADIVCEEIK